MTTDYGVFNDSGCIDGPMSRAEAETVAAAYRAEGDEYAKAAEICPDHGEQPRDGCEDCATDGGEGVDVGMEDDFEWWLSRGRKTVHAVSGEIDTTETVVDVWSMCGRPCGRRVEEHEISRWRLCQECMDRLSESGK